MDEELKQLESMVPPEPTVEQLKQVIADLLTHIPEDATRQPFSRCHPTKCILAYLWPTWHPTPPHVPLYPSDWC